MCWTEKGSGKSMDLTGQGDMLMAVKQGNSALLLLAQMLSCR